MSCVLSGACVLHSANCADPDKMIVNEVDVLSGLPPLLREELVMTLYGRQLYSVPLFLNLGAQIMTELCLKLVPLSALKGSMIAREGTKGTHLFCVASGQVKITEEVKDGDDVSRLRDWIEAVFGQANKEIELIKPSIDMLIDQLLACIRKIGRAQDEAESPQSPKRLTDIGKLRPLENTGSVHSGDSDPYDDATDDSDDELDELQKRLKELDASGRAYRVSFKSLLYHDQLTELCRKTNVKLRVLVTEAARRGKIHYQGALELTKTNPEGPYISQVKGASSQSAIVISPQQQLCGALQDGEILADLIKLLSQRLADSGESACL